MKINLQALETRGKTRTALIKATTSNQIGSQQMGKVQVKRVHSNMPSRDGVKIIQSTKSCNLMTSSNCRQSATDRAAHSFS